MASVRIGNTTEQPNLSKAIPAKRKAILFPLKTQSLSQQQPLPNLVHNSAQFQSQAQNQTQTQLETQNAAQIAAQNGAQHQSQALYQPQPENSEFNMVMQHLAAAKEIIETSQTKVLDLQTANTSLQRAFEQELQLRLSCSDAYKQLHSQHRELISSFHNSTDKCSSLDQQLKEAQEMTTSLELTIRALKEEKSKTGQQQKNELTEATNNIRILEWKINTLEKEKIETVLEHQHQLAEGEKLIASVQQKIIELENDKERMIHENLRAVAKAAGRITDGEQKLGKERNILELPEPVSSTNNNRKRQRLSNEPGASLQKQCRPATRSRMRQYGAAPEEKDTIEVTTVV